MAPPARGHLHSAGATSASGSRTASSGVLGVVAGEHENRRGLRIHGAPLAARGLRWRTNHPGAGQGVGMFPYLAAGTRPFLPTANAYLKLGGTRAGNAAAKEAGWPKVLEFLAGLGHERP